MVRPRSEFTEEEIYRSIKNQIDLEILDCYLLMVMHVFNVIEQGGLHPSELVFTVN